MTKEQLLEFLGEDFLEALLAVRNHCMDTMPVKPTEKDFKLFRYWLRVDYLVDLLLAAVDDRKESTF